MPETLQLISSRAGAAVTGTLVSSDTPLSNVQRHLFTRCPQVWTRVKGVVGMESVMGEEGFPAQGLAGLSSAGDSAPAW